MLNYNDKIKLLCKAIAAGHSESCGCSDNEDIQAEDLFNKLMAFNDSEFKEFCERKLPRIIAYGG